jgi:hypothetical protein
MVPASISHACTRARKHLCKAVPRVAEACGICLSQCIHTKHMPHCATARNTPGAVPCCWPLAIGTQPPGAMQPALTCTLQKRSFAAISLVLCKCYVTVNDCRCLEPV